MSSDLSLAAGSEYYPQEENSAPTKDRIRLEVVSVRTDLPTTQPAYLTVRVNHQIQLGTIYVETLSVERARKSMGSLIARHEAETVQRGSDGQELKVPITALEQRRLVGEGLLVVLRDGNGQTLAQSEIVTDADLTTVGMLYNPGPRWLARRVRAAFARGDVRKNECTPMSTLQEAAAVGNPGGRCAAGYLCDGHKIPAAPNGACATYTVATAGWESRDYGKLPGWWFEDVSGGAGAPLTTSYVNRAYGVSDPCRIREVGLVFDRRSGAFIENPDGTPLRFGEFKRVIVKLRAKVDLETLKPPQCQSMPTAYITIDFRVGYALASLTDLNGPIQKGALLGILLYGNDGQDARGSPSTDYTFWTDGSKRRLIHGSRLSAISPNLVDLRPLNAEFQEYEIDFKSLFESTSTPPQGYSIGDAYVNGVDIYTSVRGASLDFTLSDVSVYGVR